jgi:prepilin-type N-terminal cleavage/methylation domain-containing protein
MLTNIRKRNEGFTIVETLIVLAIAGLIILIVLLAVPALQRNSRNTNLKNDASAISGAISEFESNNGGSSPLVADYTTGTITSQSWNITQLGDAQATAKIQVGDFIYAQQAAATPDLPIGAAKTGAIAIVVGQTCSFTAAPRATAVYYNVETTSSTSAWTTTNCIDS